MNSMNLMVLGEEVLAIKWQNDDEKPSIRLMSKVDFVYAETEIGFQSEEKRDHCWAHSLKKAAEDFVELAKSAAGQ